MNQVVVGKSVERMFGSIAERYDITNTVLSGGVHFLWRWLLLSRVPKLPHGKALDLCTGTGALLPGLARRVGRVVGVDFCAPMLAQWRPRNADQAERIAVQQADALNLPFGSDEFDVLTVAYGIRNLEDYRRGLREMYRVAKPGGLALVLEFGRPRYKVLAQSYALYARYVMPLIGAVLTGNREAYTYLPETAQAFPCDDQFCAIMEECGFKDVRVRALSGGIAYLYQGSK